MILTKPLKEAGEQLGFLPGEIENKIDPFYESFANNLIKIIKEPNYKKLLEKKTIQCKPLAYLRGTGFDNSLMILDEAQNATMKQLMLFITRMGKGSKIIINGDVRQYDIEKNNVALPFLMENVLKGIDEVDTFEFNEDDIMRDEILIEITKRYELLKNEGKIPKNF